MEFRNYPDEQQALFTARIRSAATRHQQTPLYLWRTALESVNPYIDLMSTPTAICRQPFMLQVYDLLDVATDTF